MIVRNNKKHGRWIVYKINGVPFHKFIGANESLEIPELNDVSEIKTKNNGQSFEVEYDGTPGPDPDPGEGGGGEDDW